MATTFSVKSGALFEGYVAAWNAVRILTACVEHVAPNGEHFPPGTVYELSGDNKRWARNTLSDMAVVHETHELTTHTLYWNWAETGLMWRMSAQTFHDGKTRVELQAYAGTDLIKTEEAMRTVLARAAERGVKMSMGTVRYAADERQTVIESSIVINKGPMKKWKIFRSWVGPHLPSYVVGTLASVTATVLLFVLGFSN